MYTYNINRQAQPICAYLLLCLCVCMCMLALLARVFRWSAAATLLQKRVVEHLMRSRGERRARGTIVRCGFSFKYRRMCVCVPHAGRCVLPRKWCKWESRALYLCLSERARVSFAGKDTASGKRQKKNDRPTGRRWHNEDDDDVDIGAKRYDPDLLRMLYVCVCVCVLGCFHKHFVCACMSWLWSTIMELKNMAQTQTACIRTRCNRVTAKYANDTDWEYGKLNAVHVQTIRHWNELLVFTKEACTVWPIKKKDFQL